MSTISIWSVEDHVSENYLELIADISNSHPLHKNQFGNLVVMDYKNVKVIFTDFVNFKNFEFSDRLITIAKFASNDPNLLAFSESLKSWLLFMNGTDHLVHRKLIFKKFYEADFERITEESIEEVIVEFSDLDKADLVKIAGKFSFLILKKLLNLKEADFEFIKKFSYGITMIFEKTLTSQDLVDCAAQSQEFKTYMSNLLNDYEMGIINNVFTEMKDIMGSERIYELVSTWEFLVNAAMETTQLLLSRSIATLIENKDKIINWEKRDACVIAVEELIRFNSPVNWIPRQAVQDMSFKGYEISKGDTILLGIASANRDPSVFENPNLFDPSRKPNPHIGFGHGMHHCVGSKLSRFEMQKFIPRFMQAFPNIRFDPEEKAIWDKKVFFRGYKYLPVLLR